jgi:signal transduction histidine kinase
MITADTKMQGIKYPKLFMTAGIVLIAAGLMFPLLSQFIWFNVIITIREAINAGDSGHLILASAMVNFLYAIQNTILFMGAMLVIYHSELKARLKTLDLLLVSLIVIIALHWVNALVFELPWEPVSTISALLISLFLFVKLFGETNSFVQVFIVSIQVFFAFHWLNIMPIFSDYRFGQSDIPHSVKTAGVYLHASSVLNFSGFAFFLPFIVFAFITATLFISYSRNIHMMRENYEKENEIRSMRTKALEDRVYREVKSLVHDLKTPLVTVRGLNSLIVSADSRGKLEEYSERIEHSVIRMSEMISSFLYETSRQRLKASELISYIRAQLPLEDEAIRFEIEIEEELPEIYVNKIRIARAVINILENAIIVPHKHSYKLIRFKAVKAESGMKIMIEDNGIGIADSDIDKIWEVGYSTNNTSGLGLPFAKRIIEDNDGTIELRSQLDVGTEVSIFLPAAENISKQAINSQRGD